MTDKEEPWRKNLIEQAFLLGFNYEKNYKGCCQCAIAAIQDALEFRDDAVFKAASGLTAGGGLTCEGSCGGFIAGVMIISSFFGRRRDKWNNDKENKDCAHRMAKELSDKFYIKYQSVICKNIHYNLFGRNFNLLDPLDKESFEELGAHKDKCTTVIGNASAWTAELILKEMAKRNMKQHRFNPVRPPGVR